MTRYREKLGIYRLKYPFTVEEYFISCDRFLEAKSGNFPNIYTIRYEDFFVNGGKAIKDIMDDNWIRVRFRYIGKQNQRI